MLVIDGENPISDENSIFDMSDLEIDEFFERSENYWYCREGWKNMMIRDTTVTLSTSASGMRRRNEKNGSYLVYPRNNFRDVAVGCCIMLHCQREDQPHGGARGASAGTAGLSGFRLILR